MTAFAEPELRRRQSASQRGFFRMLASAPNGSSTVAIGAGLLAAIIPARPSQSIYNSVLYDDPLVLAAALPALTEIYEASDVSAWTVWVPPGETTAPRLLEAAGHRADATPMLMGAGIHELDLEQRRALDLHPEPGWDLLARISDGAWETPPELSAAAVLAGIEDPAAHVYAALGSSGEAVCALLAREEDDDCYFWFVSTLHEARGTGLASELMRHALREARRRGCRTTTLESSSMAQSAYAKLGFRAFGNFVMWERRDG